MELVHKFSVKSADLTQRESEILSALNFEAIMSVRRSFCTLKGGSAFHLGD